VAVLVTALFLSVAALATGTPGQPGKPANPGKSAAAKSGPAAAQYQYGQVKVQVCHKGKKTIRIAQPAVRAHLRHGDSLGPCP
jgi:hypothetical protein